MAKKKKKKKTGATRATYAKGRAPAPAKKESRSAVQGTTKGGTAGGGGKAAGAGSEAQLQQFNIIKRGTLEMKVFQTLIAILAVAALLQYPLWSDIAQKNYGANMKKYKTEFKKWEKDYPNKKSQEEHADDKPQKPVKPSFNIFLMYYALMTLIEGGLFAFVGLNISRRTDLGTPLLDGLYDGEGTESGIVDLLKYAVPAGVAVLVPLLAASLIGRSLGYSKTIKVQYAAWKNALYYAGFSVQNQMLLVLLLTSLLVWVFARYRVKTKFEPHWAGISAAALLGFGYFFYVSRAGGEKVSVGLVASALLVVSLVVIPGYLFWKKGLEYSLLAGAVGFAVYPFLAAYIIG